MSRISFWGGILLYTYDAASHLYCYIANVAADNGYYRLAWIWNNYAEIFYPKLLIQRQYDLHWSIIHWTAIFLLVFGYITKKLPEQQVPSQPSAHVNEARGPRR